MRAHRQKLHSSRAPTRALKFKGAFNSPSHPSFLGPKRSPQITVSDSFFARASFTHETSLSARILRSPMTAPLWLLPLQEETGGSFTGGAPTSAHTDGSFPGDTAITVPPQRLPQHAMYLPEPSWPHALPWWLPPRRWSPLAASSSPPADTSCGRLPPSGSPF